MLVLQVLCELSQLLEAEVEISPGLVSRIVSELVSLAEVEPCGVRGGTIVVLFSSDPQQPVGKIRVDPGTVSTFQLSVTILPQTDFRTKIVNFLRKVRGKQAKIVVDQSFSIEKKKLFLVNGKE